MKIGIDFDNTIACYDGVFHAAALQSGLIPDKLPYSKTAVRDYLNSRGQNDEFTKLQGYVYGSRMDLVGVYEGFSEFISTARASDAKLYIVSHKTKRPILGPEYNLHRAALDFMVNRNIIDLGSIPIHNVFFEETKEQKIARAREIEVDFFIDDLPEILSQSGFPDKTRKILFDPNSIHNQSAFERYSSWSDIRSAIFG